jgi:hypothetical protein
MKKTRARSGRSSPEPGAGTVRERTLAHMESLMRTATTVGAGIVLACGARAQTSQAPQVCDPLPAPVGCCENPDQLLLRVCLNQQTRWVKSGMRWTLQLSLSAHPGPTRLSFEGLKREVIKVYGVSIKDMKIEPQRLGFVLAAGASSRQATVQFPVLCNDKKVTLKLNLDLSKAPVENGSVPVKLVR